MHQREAINRTIMQEFHQFKNNQTKFKETKRHIFRRTKDHKESKAENEITRTYETANEDLQRSLRSETGEASPERSKSRSHGQRSGSGSSQKPPTDCCQRSLWMPSLGNPTDLVPSSHWRRLPIPPVSSGQRSSSLSARKPATFNVRRSVAIFPALRSNMRRELAFYS